ncbi:hypothetical protein, partial [Pseudoalteromonas rubra]
ASGMTELLVRFVFIEKLLRGVQVDPGSHASGMTELLVRFVFIEELLRGIQVDPGSHASGIRSCLSGLSSLRNCCVVFK